MTFSLNLMVPISTLFHITLFVHLVPVKTNEHPYPTCGLPTDMFHLPTINISTPLSFAHCRPSHSSINTLLPSGSLLGLAPSTQLSQTKTPSFVAQLLEKHLIERPVFSIMLINGEEGVLSIGGTSAGAVEMVEKHTRDTLDKAGALEGGEPDISTPKIVKRSGRMDKAVSARQTDWEDAWKWSKVQGAEGWWQTLMDGVWVDGSKVLKNQPVVIDVGDPVQVDLLRAYSIFEGGFQLIGRWSDQHPFHSRASGSRQNLLRLRLRLPPTATSAFQLLRLSLS